MNLPAATRLVDAGDIAECLIHWQIIPSNNEKIISLGFSFSPQVGRLQNSVDFDTRGALRPISAILQDDVLERFRHSFAARRNQKEV